MQQPPLPPSSFVTTTARLSLVVAVAGLVLSLLQLLLAALLPDRLATGLAGLPEAPAALVWALEHRVGLSLLQLAAAALFLACSWGLLRRLEWGRIGFIAFLVATAALNFAGLALIDHVFDTFRAMLPQGLLDTPDGQEMLAQLQASRIMAWGTSVAGALAIAGLHGWLAWKLATPPLRLEFGPRRL